SIARYTRGAEGESHEDKAPEPRPEFQSPASRRDDFRGRGRDRERGRDRDRDRGRERGHDRPPRSEEDFALPKNYTPIVLPGESISKYRHQPGSPASADVARVEAGAASVAAPDAQPAAKAEEPMPEQASAETIVISGPEPEAPTTVISGHSTSEPTAAYSGGAAEPKPAEPVPDYAGLPEPGAAALRSGAEAEAALGQPEPFVDDEVPIRPRTRQRKEIQEDATATTAFAGDSASARPEPRHDMENAPQEASEPAPNAGIAAQPSASPAVPPFQPAHEDKGPVHQAGGYSPEGGPVVHEELEGEETDMPSYTEHFDTAEQQETEERVYSRQGESSNGGEVFGDTVREADEEHALRESEYDFDDEEEGDEFEESEILAGGEEEDGELEAQPPAGDNGRAELRGPSATAAYQQRAGRPLPERPGRDRQARRGGRPMRTRRDAARHAPLISDLLKEGQEVLVQIAKEPIGKKGARITSHIALPGRFLVYMPTVNHVGVSRKISSEEERQRLKRIVASERENGHGGFIVRTAAAGIKEDELRADIRFLKHLWSEIRNRVDNSRSPALIYHDLNLVERILRDQVTHDFSQIWVDSEPEYERTVRFASRFQPDLVRRIKLYTKPTPLFEQFGLQEEINKSLKSKVWLKSGGYIVINQTEALVAIDINTGKYVGKTARLEDTIVKTNCDAVKEIVRQIRLRDLGGIIVIDFIDMDERKNRQKVMQTLEEALKADRAPSKVLQFNDFGLVAITRKRVKQSLERTLGSPCPYCSASGFVKSVTTVCNEIYAELRKIRPHLQAADITLRVNPEVAKELKGNNGRWLSEMEDLAGRPILVKSDALVHQEQFDIQF
ncbi:MAG: Rne/Rng family ribonuclease, partial [Candidatus Korobacteraceae bacterium]